MRPIRDSSWLTWARAIWLGTPLILITCPTVAAPLLLTVYWVFAVAMTATPTACLLVNPWRIQISGAHLKVTLSPDRATHFIFPTKISESPQPIHSFQLEDNTPPLQWFGQPLDLKNHRHRSNNIHLICT